MERVITMAKIDLWAHPPVSSGNRGCWGCYGDVVEQNGARRCYELPSCIRLDCGEPGPVYRVVNESDAQELRMVMGMIFLPGPPTQTSVTTAPGHSGDTP